MASKDNLTAAPYLSVIVPFYNEEECIALMHERLSKAVSAIGCTYELVFVDDGSRDATYSIARSLAEEDPHLKVVKFRGNFGQTPAMAAGIDLAEGTVLVTMDGDLQNEPEDIPMFLEEIDKGYDLVVGWRHKRQDKFLTRKLPSMIANRIIGTVTGVPIKDNGCSLKAYRASVIKSVPLYSEMHRFIPAMASLAGVKISEIKVRHHAREHGVSKYGLSRIYKVILDLLGIKTILGFDGRPLRWFAMLSLPFTALFLLFVVLSVVAALDGNIEHVLNFGATALIWVSSATFLLMLGAVGELVFATGSTRFADLAALTLTSKTRRKKNRTP